MRTLALTAPALAALTLALAPAAQAAPGSPVAAGEGDSPIVLTAATGPKLLVQPDRAGVSVIAADVWAKDGATLEGLRIDGDGGEKLACGTIPATVSGTAKVHCEQALPAIPAGSTRTYTFTASATAGGKDVTQKLTFEATALAVDLSLTVNGQERSDSPVGGGAAPLEVAPGATVTGELAVSNRTSGALTVSVDGWSCPQRSVAAGATTRCTTSVTAPRTAGAAGSLDAAVRLADQDGHEGTFTKAGRFRTAGGAPAPALASTGLPVGATLAVAALLIGAGAALRRVSRLGVR